MSATVHPAADDYPGRRERRWRDPRFEAGPCAGWTPWNAPKPVLIAAMVLGFILFWPIGLAMLFFMIGSGRIGRRFARRYGMGPGGGAPMMDQGGWPRWCRDERPSTGNAAFDEYRVDTLRRLEEEQKDFAAFLERLRFAKDRSEFEQFMTDRRTRPPERQEPPAQG